MTLVVGESQDQAGFNAYYVEVMMSCWCGHGPWHHRYPYPPQGYFPPPVYSGPPSEWRRQGDDGQELAHQLQELAYQVAALRRELDEVRRSGAGAG